VAIASGEHRNRDEERKAYCSEVRTRINEHGESDDQRIPERNATDRCLHDDEKTRGKEHPDGGHETVDALRPPEEQERSGKGEQHLGRDTSVTAR
jgi:hypothetical protein